MLSRFVEEGSKIELRALQRGLEEKGAESTAKVYQSRVLQILSEDTLEISMPMEQTRLILLPVDSEYDMIFFEENSLYQCFARIIDRYKSNNVYVLVMELTSNLRKYQRREYYRFSCALDMCCLLYTSDAAHWICVPEIWRKKRSRHWRKILLMNCSRDFL